MTCVWGVAPGVTEDTVGGGSAGAFQPPKRATISRRASSTVTAPTTAMIVVSGRT